MILRNDKPKLAGGNRATRLFVPTYHYEAMRGDKCFKRMTK